MVAGGAESASTPLGRRWFWRSARCRLQHDNSTGGEPSVDKERDGFVLGDGAGMLVLEE